MSTTFDVYPSCSAVPSFQQLLDRSTAQLHRFLASVEIDAHPLIRVSVQRKDGNQTIPLDLPGPATWPDDAYAWFFIDDLPGGSDAYIWPADDVVLDCWRDLNEPRLKAREHLIRQCLDVGYFWSFRRTAGQPAIINIAYGLIAGSLAELTEGFLSSDDSAWDWQRFPALPNEFFGWYFVPELALDTKFREWSMRCIAVLLREELSG